MVSDRQLKMKPHTANFKEPAVTLFLLGWLLLFGNVRGGDKVDLLTCHANDVHRELMFEVTRSKAVLSASRGRYQKLYDLRRRGHISPQQLREALNNYEKAKVRYELLNKAGLFLDGKLSQVCANWDEDDCQQVAHHTLIPGMSFHAGGHVFFTRKNEAVSDHWKQGRHYLEVLQKIQSENSTTQAEVNQVHQLAGYLRSKNVVKDWEVRALRGQFFDAYYQVEVRKNFAVRLQRDIATVDRYLVSLPAQNKPAAQPFLSTPIPGLTTGWRRPVAMNASSIGTLLPLAYARASSRGKIRRTWIDVVKSADRLKRLHHQKRLGKPAAEIDLDIARAEVMQARTNYLKASKELEIARDEYRLLASMSGGSGQGRVDQLRSTAQQWLTSFSANTLVMNCQSRPQDFYGAVNLYTNLKSREAQRLVIEKEVAYLQDLQKRQAASRYFKASELRATTFSLEAAKASLKEADEELQMSRLALQQWEKARYLAPAKGDWIEGVSEVVFNAARQIASKRQQLDQIILVGHNLVNTGPAINLANHDRGLGRFEVAIESEPTVGQLPQATLNQLFAELKQYSQQTAASSSALASSRKSLPAQSAKLLSLSQQ